MLLRRSLTSWSLSVQVNKNKIRGRFGGMIAGGVRGGLFGPQRKVTLFGSIPCDDPFPGPLSPSGSGFDGLDRFGGQNYIDFRGSEKEFVPEPVRILCKEVRSYVVDMVWTSG